MQIQFSMLTCLKCIFVMCHPSVCTSIWIQINEEKNVVNVHKRTKVPSNSSVGEIVCNIELNLDFLSSLWAPVRLYLTTVVCRQLDILPPHQLHHLLTVFKTFISVLSFFLSFFRSLWWSSTAVLHLSKSLVVTWPDHFHIFSHSFPPARYHWSSSLHSPVIVLLLVIMLFSTCHFFLKQKGKKKYFIAVQICLLLQSPHLSLPSGSSLSALVAPAVT